VRTTFVIGGEARVAEPRPSLEWARSSDALPSQPSARASAAATLDEVFHAKACFELAGYYGGRSLGPAPLDITDLEVATELATVVERAFIDGCIGEIGETAAALVARASLDVCDSRRLSLHGSRRPAGLGLAQRPPPERLGSSVA
jgi:hypothetical protein